MATQQSNLEILIRSILTGTGFEDARAGFAGVGASSDSASAAFERAQSANMRLAEAEAQQTRAALELRNAQKALADNTDPAKQEQLTRAVVDAKRALGEAKREATEAGNAVRKFGHDLDSAGGGTQSFTARVGTMVGAMTTGAAAIGVVAGVTKKAFDFSKEGAQIMLVQGQFENLAASIGSSSTEILDDLAATSAGMMTTAEMTQSAADIISLGLANNQDDVVRLASLVNKLGWDMNTVILTFANNSKMRLDALGLSVEDVEGRMKALEEQGYSTDKAFDMAVMEAGEAKLALIGDQADTAAGSLKRMEVMIREETDAAKVWLAEGLVPWAELITGRWHDAAVQATDDLIAMAENASGAATTVTEAQTRVAMLGGALNPRAALREAGQATVQTLLEISDSYEDFVASIEAADNPWVTAAYRQGEWTEATYLSQKALQNLTVVVDEWATRGERTIPTVEELAAAMAELETATYGVVLSDEQLAAAQELLNKKELVGTQSAIDLEAAQKGVGNALNEAADFTEELTEKTDPLIEAMDRLADEGFSTQTDLIEDLMDAQADLADAQGEWASAHADNSGKIAEVNAQLAADLSGEQRQAMQDILGATAEGSAEWLAAYNALQGDLTDTQRAALVARSADLEAAHGTTVSIYSGDAQAAEDAQKRIDAANAAILESYKQTAFNELFFQQIKDNDFTAEMGAVAVGLGLMEQEQADLMVTASERMGLLEEAMTKYRGEIESLDPEVLTEFVEIIAGGETDSIRGALNRATLAINGDGGLGPTIDKDLRAKLDELNIPVGTFKQAVETDFPVAGQAVLSFREEVQLLKDLLSEMAGGYTVPVSVQVTGDAGVLAEARARGLYR